MQFLLVSRAHFHVFFGRQLEVVCEELVNAVCTTAIRRFFSSAVDRLLLPAGGAMGALLRLSSVRELELVVRCVKPPLARQMFEAINEMPVLEWLDVDVCCASSIDSPEWWEGAFPTLPPSLARFKGRWDDVQHLVGRELPCEEIILGTYGKQIIYPLNARKIVVVGGTIEKFEDYEGPLPLESTEVLEFPFEIHPYNSEENSRWQELCLSRVIGGITRVMGERKAPFLLLTTKLQVHGFVKLAQIIEEIELYERSLDVLLAECERREIRLLGLRLELNVCLYEAATLDDEFVKKFRQALKQKFGPHIQQKEEFSEWFRVESEKPTEFSMRISWDHYVGSANNGMYDNSFDDLEFDFGESREEFHEKTKGFGFYHSSEEGDDPADDDAEG